MATIFNGPLTRPSDAEASELGRKGLPLSFDPNYLYYFNDYLKTSDLVTGDFTITEVDGGGDAANVIQVLVTTAKGYLKITTDDASGDSQSHQDKIESYKLVSGKKMWFETKFSLSAVTTANFFIGLAITDTTPLDASDLVGFRVTSGAATIFCEANATGGSIAHVTSAVSAVNATENTLAWYYNGNGQIQYFIDGALVSTQSTSSKIPLAEDMALTILVATGTTAVQTALIDYIFICRER